MTQIANGARNAGYAETRCYFCLTAMESVVAGYIDGMPGMKAIIPTRIKRFKHGGEWLEEQRILFPGYLFVYGDRDADFDNVLSVPGVLRVLTYNDGKTVALEGPDALFAKTLWDLNGKISVMKAAKIGEHVIITDGVFKSLGGKVVAMDRRKMAAKVELSVVGSVLSCWLSYEFVEADTRE